MTAVYVALWRRQHDDAVLVQALGAVLAAGAALLWLGGLPVPSTLPWLAGFVVLTIAGERLELARLQMTRSGGAGWLLAASAAVVASAAAALLWPAAGYPLLGLAVLALVAWLAVHDVARRTVHATGLPRFIALCLLAGYAWLAAAALVWLLGGAVLDGPAYDAAVHAVFLGFTLSMIMAHAPVILPAVLRRAPALPPGDVRPSRPAARLAPAANCGWATLEGSRAPGRPAGALSAVAVLLLLGVLVWSATRPAAAGRLRARAGSGRSPHVLEAAR